MENDDYSFVSNDEDNRSFEDILSSKEEVVEGDPYEMSILAWIKVLIITAIPCVGVIAVVVWAFSSTANPNVKNYSRAAIVLGLIGIVAYVILIMLGVLGALLSF